jgi:hypothetical protein
LELFWNLPLVPAQDPGDIREVRADHIAILAHQPGPTGDRTAELDRTRQAAAR